MAKLLKIIFVIILVICINPSSKCKGADDIKTIKNESWEGHFHFLAFSPDGRVLASSGFAFGSDITLWDVVTVEKIRTFSSSGRASFIFSADGKMIAAPSRDNKTISLWDVATGNIIRTFASSGYKSDVCDISPDGRFISIRSTKEVLLAAGSRYETKIILFDVKTGIEFKTFEDFLWTSFNPDGKVMALSSRKKVILWDIANDRETSTINEGGIAVFSPDSKILAIASNYNVVLWDVASWKKIRTLNRRFTLPQVAFSPDGKMLALGGEETSSAWKTIIIWDVATGNKIKTFSGGDTMAFSPDGNILATSSVSPQINADIILRSWQTAKTYEEEKREDEERRAEETKQREKEEKIAEQIRKDSRMKELKEEIETYRPLFKKIGLTGKLETDLPRAAHLFRSRMIKARDWKYRIEHNTTSDKIEKEIEKMNKWSRSDVEPLATLLLNLAHQYETKYGSDKLRDFAIKNNFLDVLEDRY